MAYPPPTPDPLATSPMPSSGPAQQLPANPSLIRGKIKKPPMPAALNQAAEAWMKQHAGKFHHNAMRASSSRKT